MSGVLTCRGRGSAAARFVAAVLVTTVLVPAAFVAPRFVAAVGLVAAAGLVATAFVAAIELVWANVEDNLAKRPLLLSPDDPDPGPDSCPVPDRCE